MGQWIDWVSQCAVDTKAEDCTCDFHAWEQATERFIRLIDEDWYRIADFYRQSEVDLGGVKVEGVVGGHQ